MYEIVYYETGWLHHMQSTVELAVLLCVNPHTLGGAVASSGVRGVEAAGRVTSGEVGVGHTVGSIASSDPLHDFHYCATRPEGKGSGPIRLTPTRPTNSV